MDALLILETCSDEQEHFGSSLGPGSGAVVNFYRYSAELENDVSQFKTNLHIPILGGDSSLSKEVPDNRRVTVSVPDPRRVDF